MNKRQKIDQQIQIFATIIGAGINMYLDYQEQKEIQKYTPNYQYNFLQTLGKGAIGGLVGLGTGFIFCGLKNYFFFNYDDITPINENKYLKDVLQSYDLNEDFEALLKTEELMESINDYFYDDLEEKVTYQGSIAKGTAVKDISDIDVAVRFRNDSFYLADIKDVLYEHFETLEDREIIKVRNQPNSIGVFCKSNGQSYKIDFVPQRLQSNGEHYSIYRTPLNKREPSTRKKTNTKIHEEFGRYKQSKREMIRLFKVFKTFQKIPISGFLLERFIIEIMDRKINLLSKLNRFDRLKLVANEIANNILDVKITDPANSNNILTERLSDNDRAMIYDSFDRLIIDLKEDSRILRKNFPIFRQG